MCRELDAEGRIKFIVKFMLTGTLNLPLFKFCFVWSKWLNKPLDKI